MPSTSPRPMGQTAAQDDSALLERLRRAGAATVHEALGRVGALDPRIKPIDPSSRLVGRALTVDAAPADNLAVQYAASIARPGDVIVIDAKGYLDAGLWGDVLTLYAQQQGVAGIVVDGAVRDSQDMIAMGFPVFARGICIKGTDKVNPGRVNVPISCGGMVISPGDIIVGDGDGLTVVPADGASHAVELAEARERKEDGMRAQLRDGASLLDLLGLRGRCSPDA